jgi:hypothetical protein
MLVFMNSVDFEKACRCIVQFATSITASLCLIFLSSGYAICQVATQTTTVELPPIIFNTVNQPRKIIAIKPDGTGTIEVTDGSFDAYLPVWSPDGKKIIFCSQSMGETSGNSDSSIYILDLRTGISSNITTLNNSECENIDWSPDGEKIVISVRETADNTNKVYLKKTYILNANGNELTFFANGYCALWSCSGSCIVMYSSEKATDGNIIRIQLEDSKTTVISEDIFLYPIAISSNGESLLAIGWRIPADRIEGQTGNISTTMNGLFSVKLDGTGKINNLKQQDAPNSDLITFYCDRGCDWSEDGTKVVSHKFTTNEGHNIIIFDSYGDGETQLYKDGQYPDWRK